MSELTLQRWAREFRSQAKADNLAGMRDHLRRLGLRAKPEMLLEGTIQVVIACSAYLGIDGQSDGPFLEMQTYDPAQSRGARYGCTLEISDKAFARVLVARNWRGLDFADLYGHPWDRYRVCGFRQFWITRADSTPLKRRELAELERHVTHDLRFDYSEDELDFWFNDSCTAGALLVTVQDREDEQEE